MNRLTIVLLASLCLKQVVPQVSPVCSVDSRCVPSDSCDACRQMKCQLAKAQNLKNVDCSRLSPLIGGNQCCDRKRVSQLTSRRKRQAYNFAQEPQRQWPNPLSYAYDTSGYSLQTYQAVIPDVLSYIERQTCIRFTRVDVSSTTPHLTFTNGSACTAYVGRSDFISTAVTLTPQCIQNWGDVLYYLVQALGMFHQTQRPDRDSFVTTQPSNTDSSHSGDFLILNSNILVTFGFPYDYASIQQFPALIFSSNGQFTIVTNDPLYQKTIGQKVEMSRQDIKLINRLYCQNVCSASLLPGSCLRGGYQDPNNCTRCKCSDGFAGQFCEKYEDTTDKACGGMLNASLTERNITSPGYYSPGYYDSFARCVWRISAPNGGNISLRFIGEFGIYQDISYACYHWVEIRYKGSMNETGPRFCGLNLPQDVLVSSGSEVLIIFSSNLTGIPSNQRRGFQIAYKIVNAPSCAYVNCLNGGFCTEGRCYCQPGFTGTYCEIGSTTDASGPPTPARFPTSSSSAPVPPTTPSPPPAGCNPNPCRNNGTCSSSSDGSVTCRCINGFSGQYCTNAPCGGCNASPGMLDAKCVVPETPARNCSVNDRVDSTSGWWFWCRTNTRFVTRTVACTWSVCCDNATDFGYGCGVLGWSKWCSCPVSCGGAIQTRGQYGTRKDRVGNLFYDIVATEQQNCNTNKCTCNGNKRNKRCSPCNPMFVESGDQCVPRK